jgi:coenzyme F420-reducing hydrogenase delta subunit
VVELTTGFETNLKNNVTRKKDKYRELLRQLGKNFNQVKFINLSISSLGIFAEECSTFLHMLESIGLTKTTKCTALGK